MAPRTTLLGRHLVASKAGSRESVQCQLLGSARMSGTTPRPVLSCAPGMQLISHCASKPCARP